MILDFFMPMIPPTVTDQEHKVAVVKGKPRYYRPPELQDARDKLSAHLIPHRPSRPLEGAVKLSVLWMFPTDDHAKSGHMRITKPDTDNLNKMLKDCMTAAGFWNDDAQVAVEYIEKRWTAQTPGIRIRAEEVIA